LLLGVRLAAEKQMQMSLHGSDGAGC
jgi:hypothetical protein